MPGAPTKVLFVCVSNSGKSVMAQGLASKLAADQIIATSAGTAAKTGVNAISAQAMAEVGVDISSHRPTQLTDDLIRAADIVVVLGNQAHVDPVGDTQIEVWNTDEPSHRGVEGLDRMRLIRDDIASRVTGLAARLSNSNVLSSEVDGSGYSGGGQGR